MSLPMGVTVHTGDLNIDELIEYAEYAEELGYDAIWLTEESGKEAFSALAAIADHTDDLNLRTGIVNFYSRTPLTMAMAAATVDEIGAGRFGLGMGTGGEGFMKRGHNVEIDRPLTRAREYHDIISGLLTGDRVDYDGEWFDLESFHLRQTPYREAIEMYLAALNPNMTKLAGELFDGVIMNCINQDHLDTVRENLGVGVANATDGRTVEDVTVHTLTMTHCGHDEAEALHALKKGLAFYAATEHYHFLFRKSGFGEEAAALKELWDEGEREEAARAMSDDFVEAFTLAGDEDQWAERLAWYAEEGVYPIIYPVPRRDRIFEDMMTSIELAADAIR